MGKLLGIVAAGGTYFFIHANGWVSMAAGVIAWYIATPSTAPNKILQVVDLDKGTVNTQPMDKAAQKYLSTRNNEQ